ncbi:hypothetical protein COP1_002733 [Malus domestica]
MAQASDGSPMDYLTRFKSARNWCRVPLPEVEFVRLALNGLDVEYKTKFLGVNFRDMYELAQHVEQYDYLLREEKISKAPSRGTIYKNPIVSYASVESECVSVDAAEIVIDKPYVCKTLTQIDSKEVKTRSAPEETMKTSKVYTFDITKADAIFDQLLSAKIIKLRPGHTIPKANELKGKIYCKYHNSSKYTTNNCVVFRDNIHWIDNGKLRFPEKKMSVDTDPFPTVTVNMVDARLPRDKGKGKAEVATPQRSLNQNPRPRFNADFRSNKPPTALTGPAIVKPMIDYSTDEDSGSAVFCSKCKANVNTEPKEKSYPPIMEQPTAATQQKVLNAGQHQGVFDRLGPKVRVEETHSVRRCLDFDALFYDEDYYMQFHKKHSSNDLYGLPKACQDTIDLVLTCPDAERIIQKTSDPGLKARFQHIREARVLGFEVDPYTDIDAVDLHFSIEDLQDACIMYQE